MERPDTLDTSDIQGTKSRRPYVRSESHNSTFNTNADIEGTAVVNPLTRGLSSKSHRRTDPLNPQYSLPFMKYDQSPLAEFASAPREVLWTVEKPRWRPATQAPWEHRSYPFGDTKPYGDNDKYARQYLFQHAIPPRTSLISKDITGPQFVIEETRHRGTDPLQPAYVYNGGPLDEVELRRKKSGQMFVPRMEDVQLKTEDITKVARIGCREFPKETIKTRIANRTDDIIGAQANTWCAYPRLWKSRDPAESVEKLTNRVQDIEGAVTGTANKLQPSGGGGPPLYRSRIQAVKVGAPAMPYAHMVGSSMGSASRAADIQSVRNLPA